MKCSIKIFEVIVGIFLCVPLTVHSQVDTSMMPVQENITFETPVIPQLNWTGYFQTDDRLQPKKNYKCNWQEYRLDLKAEFRPSEQVKFYSEFWIRTFKLPEAANIKGLNDRQKTIPVEFDLREAYFDISGFIFKNMDLRAGRQRTAWGTCDKLNPTDNLNPYDMEDIWDFGRHSSSNGIRLNYYFKKTTLSGVFFPRYSPPILPNSDWYSAFMNKSDIPDKFYYSFLNLITIPFDLKTGSVTDSLILPGTELKNSMTAGIKVKTSIKRFDLSLSYAYSRDLMPVPFYAETNLVIDTLAIYPVPFGRATANIFTTLKFPRIHVAGFDFEGSIGQVGIRGETGLFFPEEIKMKRVITSLLLTEDSVLTDSIVLSSKPFLKYVFGLDYTRDNLYFNLQYCHGFVHENGTSGLNDYFVFAFEWKLFNEKLRLSLLNTALEVNNFRHFRNTYAIMYMPELAWKPVDGAEISLGARIIEGTTQAAFGKVKDNDEVFLRLKYSF